MSLDKNFIKNNIEDLCASIQYTLIEILMLKINLASKETEIAWNYGLSITRNFNLFNRSA